MMNWIRRTITTGDWTKVVHVNCGVIGSKGHGKTTLTSELTRYSNQTFRESFPFKSISDLDHTPSERECKSTQVPTHVEWGTDTLRVSHTDLPSNGIYRKNFLTHVSLLDAVLWVIDIEEGVLQDAIEQYHIVQFLTSNRCKVFPVINSCNKNDQEVIDLVKMDLNPTILGDNTDVLVYSSNSVLSTFIKSFETYFRTNMTINIDDEEDDPLLWPLENVGSIPSKGTFLAGRIESGRIRNKDKVSIFYRGRISDVHIRRCERFQRSVNELSSRIRGGAFVKVVKDLDLKRGAICFRPWESVFSIGRIWEVELKSPFRNDVSVRTSQDSVFIQRTNYEGSAVILENLNLNNRVFRPVKIRFKTPILARIGDPFLLRTGDTFLFGILRANVRED